MKPDMTLQEAIVILRKEIADKQVTLTFLETLVAGEPAPPGAASKR